MPDFARGMRRRDHIVPILRVFFSHRAMPAFQRVRYLAINTNTRRSEIAMPKKSEQMSGDGRLDTVAMGGAWRQAPDAGAHCLKDPVDAGVEHMEKDFILRREVIIYAPRLDARCGGDLAQRRRCVALATEETSGGGQNIGA